MLSKETVGGLDRHELVWRCSKHRTPFSGSFLSHLPKVQALWNRTRELSKGERRPTIGELLDLRRETQSLREDTSIPLAGRFALFRLTDAIDNTLDKAMNEIPSLRDSPEAQDLRRLRTLYKEAFSPEFEMLMERFSESGSIEDTKALGDLLFPKEHRARLLMILDYSNDSEKAMIAEHFADWVRLQGYSPSEVAARVNPDVIQRLTSE